MSDTALELLASLNAARDGVAPPLEWSAEVAASATAHAQRCAQWRQLSSDDLENGSTALERLTCAVPSVAAVAECLASGPANWLTPARCHERLIAAAGDRVRALDSQYTHAGIGSVEQDGDVYYVIDLVRIDPAAAQQVSASARSFLAVIPLWEPEPVRWRVTVATDGTELRAQLASRFAVDPKRLRGIDIRDPQLAILDRPVAAGAPPLVALSLSEFHPPFVSLRRQFHGSSATAGVTGSDPLTSRPLPPLTQLEREALQRVRNAGAAPRVEQIDVDPAILLPRRRGGSPEETIFVQIAVDVRPENEDERTAAVSMLRGFAQHHKPLLGDNRYEYALRQELTFGLERDTLLHAYQRDAIVSAVQDLYVDTSARPLLFVLPYSTNGGYDRYVATSARRVALLKHQSPEITRAFVQTREETSRLLERGRADVESLSLSTYSSLSVISAAQWEDETAYWLGVDRAAKGIFADRTVVDAVCEGDAINIVHRVVMLPDDDPEHPLQKLAGLTAESLSRHLTRALPTAGTFDQAQRRTEPLLLREIDRLIEDPMPIVAGIPESRALVQEATWLSQSLLRSEIENAYRRYRSGEQGRNLEAFVRMLKLVQHHLGGSVTDVRAAEHTPIAHQRLDAESSAAATRYRNSIAPLQERYLRGLLKRIARFLFPGGRSRIAEDLRPSITALAESLVSVHWNRYLRSVAATTAFSLPIALASRVETFSSNFLRDIEQLVETNRQRLDRFLTDPNAVVLDRNGVVKTVEGAVRAADVWWSNWLAETRERRWMSLGLVILGPQSGFAEENPFEFSASRISERLLLTIASQRSNVATQALSANDIRAVISLMTERSSFTEVIDPNRLLEHLVAHFPLQPTALHLRTAWIVIVGRPLSEDADSIRRLRDAVEQKRGTCYGTLVWEETRAVSGIHFFAECHGFQPSALVL